ncbi:hypothetical protein [Luteolibacter sp. Populi]|uniref:hypothetical protein n=1 Tax=Luteolibacter sp. Populi TaxID=3230487 RepID=UPI0034660101
MTETTTETPAVGSLEYWREEVRRWVIANPGSRKARQVKEPETAAMVLHLRSQGTSQHATKKATGVCRLEIGQILWRHKEAMDACRAMLGTGVGGHAASAAGSG